MNNARILLVDDHKMIRDGIKTYLSDYPQYQVVNEASNGAEALQVLPYENIDIVITDISMDEMDGISATQEITSQYPNIRVLALTMSNENQNIKKMINSGAAGYVLKNCTEEELIEAIETVMEGKNYYSSEVTQTIMESISRRTEKAPKKSRFIVETPLTEREKEVLYLVMKEYTNKEIAEKLFISTRTVDAHKRNLLEKTGSRNLAGLALYTVNRQLFDDI